MAQEKQASSFGPLVTCHPFTIVCGPSGRSIIHYFCSRDVEMWRPWIYVNLFLGVSQFPGAYTVLDHLFWVRLGTFKNHYVLLRWVWLICLLTTIRRTSSRLIRRVMSACAPMPFPFQSVVSFVALLVAWQVGFANGSPSGYRSMTHSKKAYVEDWGFQVTDTSDLILPEDQGDFIPETPRVSLPVSSSTWEPPKHEDTHHCLLCSHDLHLNVLELPFSCDAMLSGYEDLDLSGSDQFTYGVESAPSGDICQAMVAAAFTLFIYALWSSSKYG